MFNSFIILSWYSSVSVSSARGLRGWQPNAVRLGGLVQAAASDVPDGAALYGVVLTLGDS